MSRSKHNCDEIKNLVNEEKYVFKFKEKISIDGFNRKLDIVEEKTNKLEDNERKLSTNRQKPQRERKYTFN